MQVQEIIKNESEMAIFAHRLWQEFGQNRKAAIIFALEGDLGAGKTTFTKGLAHSMDITDTITSPTFILHDEYTDLDHIDLWRMDSADELINLGLENMIKKQRVIVIEWADKFKEQILKLKSQNAKIIWIKFAHSDNPGQRLVDFAEV